MDEHVLVIPTELFERCGSFQGFKPWDTPLIKASYEPLFDPCNQRFMPRAEAEKDPRFKQLIPYVVLAHLATATVATYERGVGQGPGVADLGVAGGLLGGLARSLQVETFDLHS